MKKEKFIVTDEILDELAMNILNTDRCVSDLASEFDTDDITILGMISLLKQKGINIYKEKTKDELNNYIKILHDEFYCTNKDGDVIDICKSKKLNSINVINYIDKNLLLNIKKILNNGSIIFIKENEFNLNELSSTINYIKSRGYNITSVSELLF